VKLVSEISDLYDPDPPTSQTDGQTTCDRNTALCTKVYRAVINFYNAKVVRLLYTRSKRLQTWCVRGLYNRVNNFNVFINSYCHVQ